MWKFDGQGDSTVVASSKITDATPPATEAASKILRTVPDKNAFYFFTDIGQYTGKSASSLTSLWNKIQRIDTNSVNFHFKRRDFEK